MILTITVQVDGTDTLCEQVLDEIETSSSEGEDITIRTGGGSFTVEVLDVEEVPA